MSNSESLLIHALAVHPDKPGIVRVRSTVRLGDAFPGVRVWFEGTDLVVRDLEIIGVKRSPRLSTITLSGDPSDLEHLVGGTYLYGRESEITNPD